MHLPWISPKESVAKPSETSTRKSFDDKEYGINGRHTHALDSISFYIYTSSNFIF